MSDRPPSPDRPDTDLDAVFKAYDIRGLVPDQLDAETVPAIGAAFARFVEADDGARTRARRPGHASQRRRAGRPPSPRACSARASTSSTSASASTDMLYFASGRARRPGRHVHRLAQPGRRTTASSSAAGRAAGRRGHRPRRPSGDLAAEAGVPGRPAPGRRRAARTLLGALRRPRPLVRRPSTACAPLKVVADTANGMGGLVVPAVFDGLPFDLEILYRRARRHLPEPSGRPDPAREPARPPGPRSSRPAPTSAWPSTATPTASSWSTRRAQLLSGSLDHRDRGRRRSSAREPGATIIHNLICSKAVPEVVRRGRRHAGAHPGRSLLHQAGDGRDRRRLRRRALRPLLLPRQLPGRLGPHRRAGRARAAVARPASPLSASCASPSSATPPRARSTRPSHDPPAVDRAGGRRVRRAPTRTASTASPSTWATGGSTCGRPTPSRCCGSTSKRPTPRRVSTHGWPRCRPLMTGA